MENLSKVKSVNKLEGSGIWKSWEVNIEIIETGKEIKIKIDDSKFLEKLLTLKNNKAERIYFAYWMQDIDFYRLGEYIGIMYSPHELSYNDYFITEEDLDKIIKNIE